MSSSYSQKTFITHIYFALITSLQPKTRANNLPASVLIPGPNSRFGSLPTSTPKLYSGGANICHTGRYSLDEGGECVGRSKSRRLSSGPGSEDALDGRTILGMGISAVHDAVLRGVPKIPGKYYYKGIIGWSKERLRGLIVLVRRV